MKTRLTLTVNRERLAVIEADLPVLAAGQHFLITAGYEDPADNPALDWEMYARDCQIEMPGGVQLVTLDGRVDLRRAICETAMYKLLEAGWTVYDRDRWNDYADLFDPVPPMTAKPVESFYA